MPTKSAGEKLYPYDYALIRVVPRVERGEFVNAGAIVFARSLRYLGVAIELDRERLLALDPAVDLAAVQAHLALIPHICAGHGPIGELGQAECFHWVVAPHSTIIQTSPVHSGVCTDPAAVLEELMETMVRRAGSRTHAAQPGQ